MHKFVSEYLPQLITAGLLTPVLGLIGAKIKELLEARDVRQQSKRLMEEVKDLLSFTDALQKAANSDAALANVPAESLASLQAAIAERIKIAVTHISLPSAVRIQERHLARDILDRLFLLHRPLVWWGWPVHALYYAFLGIFGVVVSLIIGDFQSKSEGRWDGVTAGVVCVVVPLVILNLVARLIDRSSAFRVLPN
ncbi:MAG: hypothetical protein ACREFF_13615 [Candidatus Udaeobacter sp.]